MKLTSTFTGVIIWVADVDSENKLIAEVSIADARYFCRDILKKQRILCGVKMKKGKIFSAFTFGKETGDSERMLFSNLPNEFKTTLLLMGFEYGKG